METEMNGRREWCNRVGSTEQQTRAKTESIIYL